MSPPPSAWWREPFVAFLMIGAALFAVDLALNPPSDRDGAVVPVQVSPEVEAALERAWDEKKGRSLNEDERTAVLATWVRNEALVREATRLGLDQGDAIIRRRLVQKMEFLVDGQLDVVDPEPAALAAWFAEHADDYTEPAAVSFRHHFFSRSRRGDAAQGDALAALAALGADGGDAAVAADPFAGPRSMTLATRSRVQRDFGGDFAAAITAVPAGAWSGPVRSSYGWHLVQVSEQRPARPAELHDRRAAALSDWRDAERARLRDRAIAEIVSRHVAPAP